MLHLATRADVFPFIVERQYRELPEQFREERSGLLCHHISLRNRGDEDYPGSSWKLLLWRWALVLEQETCGHANHHRGERWGLRGRSCEGGNDRPNGLIYVVTLVCWVSIQVAHLHWKSNKCPIFNCIQMNECCAFLCFLAEKRRRTWGIKGLNGSDPWSF